MNLLLDTHVLLWWLANDRRLAAKAREAIADGANPVSVSAASAWEIAIKAGLGRTRVPKDVERWLPPQLDLNGFQELPVRIAHAAGVEHLPRHHDDPFDRLLIAQARAERLTLVTADPEIQRYDVEVLPCG